MAEERDPSDFRKPEGSATPNPLLTWALGAFHTALFLLLVVYLVFRAESLGEMLGDLNTLIDSAGFLLVWVSTLFWTRWAVREKLVLWAPDSEGRMRFVPVLRSREGFDLMPRAIAGGCFNGSLALLVLFVTAALHSPAATIEVKNWRDFVDLAAGVCLISPALLIAAGFGALVGLAFSVIYAVLLRNAARLLPAQRPQQKSSA